MVLDRTDAQVIFDGIVSDPVHVVPIRDDRQSHDLVMRVRTLQDDRWGDWTGFRPVPLEVILGERHARSSLPSGEADLGLFLLFTVDTECSVMRQPEPNPARVVDELIFGDFGNGEAAGGIGLHMELLEHFGFRGCFFVDVLMEHRYGRRALERTIEAIADRGHEIQLHVHADHLGWSDDRRLSVLSGALGGEDRDAFRSVVELSVDLFERRVGQRPIAYRAGGFRIADMHFPVLEEFGIRIDSSVQPYFNSRVSDWMRTRTQPFWVGGVLEVPPTLILLSDDPDAWQARGFLPNRDLGDPVSSLPPKPGGPPRVATYISHSFELLRRRQTRSPDLVAAFSERLRSAVSPDVADRLLQSRPREIRTFGEEVDEGVVAAAAGILRRIADRPDARCATYAELAASIDRFWPDERHPPVDPIPVLDRRQGIASVAAMRIYGRGLLSHLADRESSSSFHRAGVDAGTIVELERCEEAEFRDRVRVVSTTPNPGERLRVRLRTLGIAADERRGALPPLAEVLFPLAVVRGVADEMGVKLGEVVAWDAATFRAWFLAFGFEIVSERRLPRQPRELTVIDRFEEKLQWLDPEELRIEAIEMELRLSRLPAFDPPLLTGIQVEQVDAGAGRIAATASRLDSLLLAGAAVDLYEAMRPGQELRLKVALDSTPLSRTTLLLALMRAGLEILDEDRTGYRVVRPVELSDIRRFAGLDRGA
jgi:hypothetical protein